MTSATGLFRTVSLASLAWAAALTGASSAAAQTAPAAADREVSELVVTAQVRAERLQDVPLSIAAVSGETLRAKGVTTLEELSTIVPSVKLSSWGNPAFVFIRGIGTGNNLAAEQSVGTFVDGVYFGRDRAAKAMLFDLERVEVLKGPQVTLFGKNTIGGAFSILTRSPGAEPEGYLQANYETELGSSGVEGAYTLPVSDKLRVRIGGRYQDNRGWVETGGPGGEGGAQKQTTGRVVVVAEPTENLSFRLKAEAGSLKGGLDPFELIATSPLFLSAVQAIDRTEDGALNRHGSGPGLDPVFNQAFNNVDTHNYTLTSNWNLNGHTLTSLTSYVDYSVRASGDVDDSALSLIVNNNEQDYSATSQEFKLISPVGKRLEYIAGLYFSDEAYEVHKAVSLNFTALPAVNAAVPGVFPRRVTRNQFFEQKVRTWSEYVQGKLQITDTLGLTGGLRYASVSKKVPRQELYYSAIGSTTPDATANALFPKLGLGSVHAFSGLERSEGDLSGLVRLEYKPHAGELYYASFTRGYKAGGFDEDNARGLANGNAFAPERVSSYQLGMKRDLGRGVLNADLFYNKITDLQVASFDGVAAFLVTNAAAAVSRGVEVEFRQRLDDHFTLSVQGGYLDAYYESYAGAPGVFPAALQDLSGSALPYAPKWNFNLGLMHEVSVSANWTLQSQANLYYSSAFQSTFNNDPVLQQNGFTKFDLRLALRNTRGLEVAVVGRNLTDTVTKTFGNILPLPGLIGKNYFAFSDPPRTVAIQIRQQF